MKLLKILAVSALLAVSAFTARANELDDAMAAIEKLSNVMVQKLPASAARQSNFAEATAAMVNTPAAITAMNQVLDKIPGTVTKESYDKPGVKITKYLVIEGDSATMLLLALNSQGQNMVLLAKGTPTALQAYK